MIGLAAGQLIAGQLSDRYGRRGPMLIGLVLYAVTSPACAFAGSLVPLIGLRSCR
nr:MFS transporter [Nonomuraea sp. SYSU D8015]